MEEVEWGLAELSKPDPRSKTPDHDGRRIERVDGHGYGWKILNYEMYRSLRDAEQMRATNRERQRRHREKHNGCHAMQKEAGEGAPFQRSCNAFDAESLLCSEIVAARRHEWVYAPAVWLFGSFTIPAFVRRYVVGRTSC